MSPPTSSYPPQRTTPNIVPTTTNELTLISISSRHYTPNVLPATAVAYEPSVDFILPTAKNERERPNADAIQSDETIPDGPDARLFSRGWRSVVIRSATATTAYFQF